MLQDFTWRPDWSAPALWRWFSQIATAEWARTGHTCSWRHAARSGCCRYSCCWRSDTDSYPGGRNKGDDGLRQRETLWKLIWNMDSVWNNDSLTASSKCSTFSCLVCFMSARGDISTVQTFCLWGTANENNLGLRVEDRNYNGLFVVEDKDCTKTQLMLNSDSCKDILIESNNEYTELGMGITGPL